jgi:hypothetical protein
MAIGSVLVTGYVHAFSTMTIPIRDMSNQMALAALKSPFQPIM